MAVQDSNARLQTDAKIVSLPENILMQSILNGLRSNIQPHVGLLFQKPRCIKDSFG